MTHEELLGAISIQLVHLPPYALGGPAPYLLALRAVVELHKPFREREDGLIICNMACNDEGGYLESYPCPTIEAIEKELK